MRGIFCARGTANVEEYKKVVKVRIWAELFLAVMGVATVVVSVLIKLMGISVLPEFANGFLTGAGTGLAVAGTIFAVRMLRMLKDENKLREARIKESDERLVAINHSAIRLAALVLIVAMYVVMLVGVFFSKELVFALSGLVLLFFVVYGIANAIFSRRM